MMGYATMWAYVWDFVDVGISKAVRELKSAGLDAVSVAAKYHTVEHLRPRARRERWFVARHAACYFRPTPHLYRATPLKPIASPLLKDGDWFGQICEAAQKVGLKVIAWTVFLHDTRLGLTHPDACMVNCFGDVYTSNLCPANPAVREFCKALVRDLSRYPLMAIEAESLHYGGIGHFHAHEKIGVVLGEAGNFLLGLCFCRHCQAQAKRNGVNAASLRRTVTELLQPTFETGKPPAESTDELFDRYPDLRAFADARERVVADLVAEVATESKVPLSFILMGSRWDIGASANSLNGSVARFEILAYTSSSREVARRTKATLREVKDGERLVVGLQTYPPAAPDAATLKENVQAAWQAGARCLSFYHYGIMPPANLAWVAEALASVRS
jgi:hypothetical protein